MVIFLWRCVMLTNKDKAIAHGLTKPRIIARFHKNTKVQDDGCIVWTKMVNESGYGKMGIAINGRTQPIYVHRFAWALKHGMAALPMGNDNNKKGDRMVLNHICHNRKCVNVNHLEIILQSENMSSEKRKPKNVSKKAR